MREGLSVVRRGLPAILAGIGLLLGGCASTGAGGDGLGYYWQSLRGQIHLLQASRPIDDWLQDDNLAPALRERLLAAQRMRSFAVQRLGLPDNASYRRYADLQRPFAVWNVVAAPPDSLELHRWCFPWPAAWATGATFPRQTPWPRPGCWPTRAWSPAATACPPIPRWAT